MHNNIELTEEEKKAIAALKRVAKKWPKSLWLFSASGTLWVMRCGLTGEAMERCTGSVDPAYCITNIAISNDGGDW
jgi:hypothetical protein